MQKNNDKKLFYYLILSLLIHTCLMIAFKISVPQNKIVTKPPAKNNEIYVEIINEIKKSTQIAETELVEKSEKTKDDAYLGQQTQQVNKQTKAENNKTFNQSKSKQLVEKTKNESSPKTNTLSNLGIKTDYKPLGHLSPQKQSELSEQLPSSSNDHLKDVITSAQTLLNTREYAYFAYYQRVKRQLEQFWEPGLKKKIRAMFDRGRQLASEKEHSTKLLVVMDKEGTITKIQVEGTSGIMDLDQAAIDAFNKAGPFPNPPKALVENDGTVKLEWEFILKT